MCHAGQAYGLTSLTNTQLAAYNETLYDYGGYYGIAMLGGAALGTGIGLAANTIVGGAGVCATNSQCSASAQNTASTVWTFSSNGPITQNGITYSQHALYRMSPVGLGGRGIPPSVVQNVIANGQQVPSRYDPTAMKITLDNVTILFNNITNTVITVRKGR